MSYLSSSIRTASLIRRTPPPLPPPTPNRNVTTRARRCARLTHPTTTTIDIRSAVVLCCPITSLLWSPKNIHGFSHFWHSLHPPRDPPLPLPRAAPFAAAYECTKERFSSPRVYCVGASWCSRFSELLFLASQEIEASLFLGPRKMTTTMDVAAHLVNEARGVTENNDSNSSRPTFRVDAHTDVRDSPRGGVLQTVV